MTGSPHRRPPRESWRTRRVPDQSLRIEERDNEDAVFVADCRCVCGILGGMQCGSGQAGRPHRQVRAGRWHNSLKPKGPPAHELTLAANGKTDYVIVVPAKPTTQEQKAALRRWLAKAAWT